MSENGSSELAIPDGGELEGVAYVMRLLNSRAACHRKKKNYPQALTCGMPDKHDQ